MIDINTLVFYNSFGYGDLFNSSEFVYQIAKIIDVDNYFYSHIRDHSVLRHLTNISYIPYSSEFSNTVGSKLTENSLYINTWIGRDSRYVLPGIGCTVKSNYNMYMDILRPYGFDKLQPELEQYIPDIYPDVIGDYTKEYVDNFVTTHSNIVLLCTGNVNSGQAYNFDFHPIIRLLLDKYSNYTFVTTSKFDIDGIYCTEDMFADIVGSDLLEIGYFSKFCNTIIGRASGPFVFSTNKSNLFDSTKKFLAMTYHTNAAYFTLEVPVKAKVLHSIVNETSTISQVVDSIGRVIEL